MNPHHGRKPRIVVIGGGTGAFTVLSGLRKYPVDLAVVVSMADDGGSTGVLREEFGMLPPGDVRRALVALARTAKNGRKKTEAPDNSKILAALFNYRFEEGGLAGHNFGNILLTALERITGSFKEAVIQAGRILGVEGIVLPVTFDDTRLCAQLEDGTLVRGESNIDIPKHNGALRISRVWLDPPARINPDARQAIVKADLIVIGPGDLYTSIVPNFLVKGVSEAVRKSRAKKVYVANIMTKWGETDKFTAADFIRVIHSYIGENYLDYALINTAHPAPERLKKYESESARFVERGNLPARPACVCGDFLRPRGFVRHDADMLAEVLFGLLQKKGKKENYGNDHA